MEAARMQQAIQEDLNDKRRISETDTKNSAP